MPSSCGKCGIVCANQCIAGHCAPPVTTFVDEGSPVQELLLLGDTLYLASGKQIVSAPTATGTTTLLATAFSNVNSLVIDAGTHLYWSDSAGIWRVELPAGSPEQIVQGPVGKFGLNTTHVFWFDANSVLRRKGNAGGMQEIVAVDSPPWYWASGYGHLAGVVADGQNVFVGVVHKNCQGCNMRSFSYLAIPVAGGTATTVDEISPSGPDVYGQIDTQNATSLRVYVHPYNKNLSYTLPKGYSSPGGVPSAETSFTCGYKNSLALVCADPVVAENPAENPVVTLASDGGAAYFDCPAGVCRVCY